MSKYFYCSEVEGACSLIEPCSLCHKDGSKCPKLDDIYYYDHAAYEHFLKCKPTEVERKRFQLQQDRNNYIRKCMYYGKSREYAENAWNKMMWRKYEH